MLKVDCNLGKVIKLRKEEKSRKNDRQKKGECCYS